MIRGRTSGLQYVHIDASMADELEALELASFPTADPKELYSAEEYVWLAEEFPHGCVVGFDGDARTKPVAVGTGIRSNFDFSTPQHNVKTFFDDAPTKCGDDPNGIWYYGTDIAVHSDYRRRGIGKELYDLRKQICRDLDLAGIIAGGVIPGYAEHKATMSADDYIQAVVASELYDPTLTFQLENGFRAGCALVDYLADPMVDNYAALIVWQNDEYSGSVEVTL